MNITKKMKTIGFTSLAALTLVAATSIVSFASTGFQKPARTSAAGISVNTSEAVTTVKPNQISIIKSGDGIEIQATTTDKIDNANVTESGTTDKIDTVSRTEPAKADSDKAK